VRVRRPRDRSAWTTRKAGRLARGTPSSRSGPAPRTGGIHGWRVNPTGAWVCPDIISDGLEEQGRLRSLRAGSAHPTHGEDAGLLL